MRRRVFPALLLRIHWRTIRGPQAPYPGIRRAPLQALQQAALLR